MTTKLNAIGPTGRRITGRVVLFCLLGFFGLIMTVNGVFVYLALDSFSGLTTDRAYQKGLAYNERLAAERAQRALGWVVVIEVDWRGPNTESTIAVLLRDRDGVPLDGMALSAELRRPAEARSDRHLEFSGVGSGRYVAGAALAQRGNWDLHLSATAPDGTALRVTRRLWLKSSR